MSAAGARAAFALLAMVMAGASSPALAAAPDPAGTGVYDDRRTVILDAVIRSIDWKGERLRLVVGAFDGLGGAPDWAIEGPEVATLRRLGWNPAELTVGTKLDVVAHPAADDSRRGKLQRFYFFDGRSLETSATGVSHAIPAEAFAQTWSKASDDPLAGYYGNTVIFKARKYEGHAWFNADHTVTMASRDLMPDGTWQMRMSEGVFWLQKLQGKYIQCMYFEKSPLPPFCHSPVNYEQVGAKWEIRMPEGTAETREIVAGRR